MLASELPGWLAMYLAKASGEISLVSETAQPCHLPHLSCPIEQIIACRVHPALEHQLSEGLPIPLRNQCVSGMRIGIVGMGRVGRAVATRAAAFGCAISYTDLQPMSDVNHTFIANLKQLASNSDALILAAAADKAEAIINAEVQQALGKDGYLINVALGKLVNEVDLVAALAAGEIAGAALDVFVDEPNVPETLFANEKVVLQPHRASATLQTRTRMGELVVASLVDSFAGRKPQGSVTD